MGRRLIFGDLHGSYKALMQCLEKADFCVEKDVLYSVGDIADGYPDVYECLSFLKCLPSFHPVIGNHDVWLQNWLSSGIAPEIWTKQGGSKSIASFERNGISDAEIICGDFTEMNLSGFDVVVCNPPFFQMDDHFKPALTPRSIARHEFFLPLSELFCKIRLSLKENGRLYMVHRSERLADLMEECRKNRLEIKTLQLVYDARKEQAVSVLIEAVLGGKKGCQVPHPILLKKDGTFERNPLKENMRLRRLQFSVSCP